MWSNREPILQSREMLLRTKPVVIVVQLNEHPVRALIDSGSLGDFVSTTTVEQLKLDKAEAVLVQLAVQGLRSKINYGTSTKF